MGDELAARQGRDTGSGRSGERTPALTAQQEELLVSLLSMDPTLWSRHIETCGVPVDDACVRAIANTVTAAVRHEVPEDAAAWAYLGLALVPTCKEAVSGAAAYRAFGLYAASCGLPGAVRLASGLLLLAADAFLDAQLDVHAAGCLLLRTQCCEQSGRLAEARRAAVQAQIVFERVGDSHGSARCLAARAAIALDEDNDPGLAEQLCFEALATASRQDLDVHAAVHMTLGDSAFARGEVAASEGEVRSALAAAQEVSNAQLEAECLTRLAYIVRERGRPDEAARLCEQALPHVQRHRWGLQEAHCWLLLAQVRLGAGADAEAEKAACRALDLAAQFGSEYLVALALRQLGTVSRARGDLEGAQLLYQLALARMGRSGRRRTMPIRRDLATIRLELDSHDEPGRRDLLDVLASGVATADPSCIGLCSASLADAALRRDQREEAERWAESAAEAFETCGRTADAAQSLHMLGQLVQARCDLPAAEGILERALIHYQQQGASRDLATCQLDLAEIGYLLERWTRPEALAREALLHFESIHDVRSSARAHLVLGRLASANCEPSHAHGHLREAARMFRDVNDRDGHAEAQLGIADLAWRTGDHAGALDQYGEALAAFVATSNHAGAALCFLGIAEVAQARADWRRARAAVEAARVRHPEGMSPPVRLYTEFLTLSLDRLLGREASPDVLARARRTEGELLNLGYTELAAYAASEASRAAEELGDDDEAHSASVRATGYLRDRAVGIPTVVARLTHGCGRNGVYDQALRLANAREDGPRVHELMEQRRGRLLLDAAFATRPILRSTNLGSTPGATDPQPDGIGGFSTPVLSARPMSFAEVASALAEGEALVHYWFGTEYGLAACIWRHGNDALIGVSRIPCGREAIAELVADFGHILGCALPRNGSHRRRTAGIADWAPLANCLWSVLVAPWVDHVRACRRLIIVPDGPLWLLPFEALLPSASRPLPLLVREFELAYHLSASLACARAPRLRQSTRKRRCRALLFGDPAIDPELTPDLSDLPGARSELRMLAEVYGIGSDGVCSRRKATRQALTRQMPRSQVCHLATHYADDVQSPSEWAADALLRGGLLVAPSAEAPGAEGTPSAYVRASEIANLDLHSTDLVVYSACDTGHGRECEGEGVVGLAWATLFAGARSVVCSRWRLDDDVGAPELMRAFHEGLVRADLPAAEALRQAQLGLADREGALSHPRYWASCFLVGARNWRLSDRSSGVG